MVTNILNSSCQDTAHPFQSKGDVAAYFLEINSNRKKDIKVIKFNADCIKKEYKIESKICDSFFYLKAGGKSQVKDKWILVETKGQKFSEAFEQLETSLKMFSNTGSPIYGRIVGKNVPNTLGSSDRKLFDNLQQKFIFKNGTLHLANRIMKELIISIEESKFN